MLFVVIFSGTLSHAACCQVKNRWGETKYYDTFSEGWCYVVHAADSNPKTMTTIKLLTNWEASKDKVKITARGEKYTVGKYNLGEDLARKHVEGLDDSKSKVDAFSDGHGNNQDDDGELINVSKNAFLQIIDSNPSVSKNIEGIEAKGGCLMGGASEDGAGAIHIKDGGFVQMKGGNICCNQTCDHGGAIKLVNSSKNLILIKFIYSITKQEILKIIPMVDVFILIMDVLESEIVLLETMKVKTMVGLYLQMKEVLI